MIHKRHFADEDSFEFPCKHPKLCDYANHLAPIVDFNPPNDTGLEPQTSGTSSGISRFLWESSSIAEADAKIEAALHLSFLPEYFAPQHQLRALLQSEETYSSLLEAPPLIPVSIGPEHQADVPEWNPRGSKSFVDNLNAPGHQVELSPSLDFKLLVDDGDEEKLMGTCIISMPAYETSANYCFERCGTRNDCKCIDRDSIDCVRQHVMEAREKLRGNLGEKIFEELGFCEMGEEVSKRWTGEEEQTFHEVVLSNPASMGKNFWNHLSLAFPFRTKRDLVSYYYNVFMLQKRADQNRFDPQNVDSDNDEWYISEHEADVVEEDEDSGVESPTNLDVPTCQEYQAEDCHDDIEGEYELDDFKDGAQAVCAVATDEDEGDVDDISVGVKKSFGDSGGNIDLHFLSKIQSSCRDEDGVQDDSCTSCEFEQIESCDPLYTKGTDQKQSNQD
ncbi:uncharacterized protein LOC123197849 [Mangifera indica]|uniref:uncharacterized protein LOC123197849 n=1 Tax=Mangifera indica TaxID=29780 RepID=UPI001CFA03D7|nr:uncharacterized protein LOC123197849 [Mangifera indica]XP_044468235.1 uncharacterized protein LOC123197849 [Mangifera indica]